MEAAVVPSNENSYPGLSPRESDHHRDYPGTAVILSRKSRDLQAAALRAGDNMQNSRIGADLAKCLSAGARFVAEVESIELCETPPA